MKKRRPHYDLKAILAQMICIDNMNLTLSAQQGIRVAGMTRNEALEVIKQLSATNFYKSMTTIGFGRMCIMQNGEKNCSM